MCINGTLPQLDVTNVGSVFSFFSYCCCVMLLFPRGRALQERAAARHSSHVHTEGSSQVQA